MTRPSALFLAAVLAGTPAAVRATPLSDAADALAPGAWTTLETDGIEGALLGTGGASGFIFGYAESIRWDPITRRLYYVGSDHNQAEGARFVTYDEATNRWEVQPQQPWMDFGGIGAIHGYDHLGMDVEGRALHVRPFNSRIVHRYDLDARTWGDAPDNTEIEYNNCCVGIAWFAQRRSLVWASVENGELGGLVELHEGAWSRLASDLPIGAYQSFAEENPVHGVVLFGGGNDPGSRAIHRLDADGTVTRLADAPVDLGVQQSIVTVDPGSGDYLVFSNPDRFDVYDVTADAWQRQDGVPPIFEGDVNDPAVHGIVAGPISTYNVNVFVDCHASGCTVRLYRHSREPAPPRLDAGVPPDEDAGGGESDAGVASRDAGGMGSDAGGGGGGGGCSVSRGGASADLVRLFVFGWLVVLAGCGDDATPGEDGGTPGRDAGPGEDAGSPPRDAGLPEDAGPTGGCFAEGERPPTIGPAGFRMPTLEDERAAYRAFGWTWMPGAEPNLAAEPGYTVSDPDIHGDTEGDDLWSHLMMWLRTGQQGYLDRATAWARYFKEDYRACTGGEYASFCYDRDAFGADHLWGWGLLAWAEERGDPDALAEAERIGEVVEALWADDSPFGCLPAGACTWYGVRQAGRHLLFATRLAEVTGDARWAQLRDRMLDRLLTSDDWDEGLGSYFMGEWSTDEILGAGSYAAGARITSAFQLGVLSEAFDHVYRVTGDDEVRRRMVRMAEFVSAHGLDPTYQYTASYFGVVGGETWHSYAAEEPVEFWDPVYTTSLVNLLVRGFRYSCDARFFERARHFFQRGNGGLYGQATERAAPDGEVHHFVDSVMASASGGFYLDYNKGELQYTYLLFEGVAP